MSEPSPSRPLGPEVASHPAPFPGKPTLVGKYVKLEALSTSHIQDLFKAVSGLENIYLFDYIPDDHCLDFETFSTAITTKANNEEWLYFAIISQKSKKAVGYLCLMHIVPQFRILEVGNVLFSPQMQNTPGGTECIFLIAKYVFEDLGYRRFEWKANSLNTKSRRAAERLGFSFEGVFRQHMIIKGRNRDTAWYSMLDNEWPGIKEGFEKWLDDGNFDEDGKQRFTLQALRNEIVEGGSQ